MLSSDTICRMIRRGAALLLAGLAGCSAGPQLHDYADSKQAMELKDVPFYAQEGYQGGPAALAMMLGASGVQATPSDLVKLVYDAQTNDSARGAMIGAASQYGRVGYQLRSKQLDLDVVHQVQAGHPVLVLLHTGLLGKQWQYVVVMGVDPAANTFTLRSGSEQRQVMSYGDFVAAWHDGGYWAEMIARPGDIPPTATARDWLNAARLIEQAGKTEAATQAYTAITQHWPGVPEDAEAWGGLGRNYYALHNPRGAITAFNNAATLEPNNPDYHNGLALALLDRQCADQAESEIDLALDLVHDPNQRGPYLKTQKEVEKHSGPSVVCPLE